VGRGGRELGSEQVWFFAEEEVYRIILCKVLQELLDTKFWVKNCIFYS
jgi:hypothetical protein